MNTKYAERHSGNESLILTAILSSGFISTLGIGLFSFTLPLLSLDEKISGIWLGSAFAGYYFAKLLVAPLSGVLSDKIGPRYPLFLAALTGMIVPLLYLVYPTLIVLYSVQFVLGLISGLIKPVGLATLGAIGGRNSLSRWFSLHALAFNVALFLGPLLGGYLYLNRSINPILIALSLCMGFSALIVMFFVPKETRTFNNETGFNEKGIDVFDSVVLFLAIAGRTLGIGLMAAFYPILLAKTLGHSKLVLGAVFAIPNLMVCVGLPIVGRLTGNTPKSITVVVGMLISAGALFALGTCHNVLQFVIFGAVMGIGAAISIPSSMILASRLDRRQGKVFGFAHLATGIGFLVGPIIGGIIIQNIPDVGSALQVAAVIGGCVCMPLFSSALRIQFNWSKVFSYGVGILCSLMLGGFGTLQFAMSPDDSNTEQSGLYRYTSIAMGTVVNLTLQTESQKSADDASRKVLATMRTLQRDFDYRDPNGSIGEINRAAGRYWVTPSDRSFGMLQRTLLFSAQTGGVFDPTVGALTTSPLYYVLDETVAQATKGLVDYRLVMVDETENRVRLKKEGMALDMGGIAKGTIIDAAVKLLKAQGIVAGIVEAGGDFYCFGDRNWTVGIRHPRAKNVYGTVVVREKGVCGSGDYEQFITTERGGETLMQHHIIDPSDMESADKSAGVTVIAESAEKADSLATALFIMGPEKGIVFMRRHYSLDSALWFKPDLTVVATDNFPQ